MGINSAVKGILNYMGASARQDGAAAAGDFRDVTPDPRLPPTEADRRRGSKEAASRRVQKELHTEQLEYSP